MKSNIYTFQKHFSRLNLNYLVVLTCALTFISNNSEAQTVDLVINGNFAAAHSCPESNFTSDATCDSAPPIVGPGNIAVTNNAYTWNGPWYGTSRTTDGTNFLVSDGGTEPNTRIWIQSVDVTVGKQYTFIAWVKNIVNPGSGAGIDHALPTVSLRVNGTVVATSASLTQDATNSWTQVLGIYTATATETVSLDVYQNIVNLSYNDVGVDDISFTTTTVTGIFSGNSNATTWDIKVAPNPFTESTAISIESPEQEKFYVETYSMNGLLLNTQSFMPTENLLVGKELNTGMYFLKIYQNGISQTMKVIKQ